jgi:hypothetical protein
MLHELIVSLGKEEVRAFKLLMGRVETEEGRLTLRLFDLLRREAAEPDAGALVQALYGRDDAAVRARLYALRAKLLRELQRCLVFQHRDLDSEQAALQQFMLARILAKKGRNGLARAVLDKAAQQAEKGDLFHVRELVYRELLGLSVEDPGIPVEALIDRRRENVRKLEFVRSSQNAMSYVLQTLRKTNFAKGGEDVIAVMAGLQAQLEENADIFQSPRGRLRLFNLTSNLLLQQQAFHQLEVYVRQEYAFFMDEGYFDRNTHRTKIVMLFWLVNTTFKNYRFEDSLGFAAQLLEALEAHHRLYYDQFIVVYHNAIVNTYIGLGRTEEAVALLQRLTATPALMADARGVFLLLNLAEASFELGKYRRALRALAAACLHKGFAELAALNQLQVYVFELIVRYESGDHEFMGTRIAQVRGWYREALGQHAAATQMLALLERNAELALQGQGWSEAGMPPGQGGELFLPGENEIVDYRLWRQSKVEGRPYRELLLETISRNRAAGRGA